MNGTFRDSLQVRGLQALGAWLAFLNEKESELQSKREKLRAQEASHPTESEGSEAAVKDVAPLQPHHLADGEEPALPPDEEQEPWL